ncbi:glycosyltransferase family 8 protein [Oceanobacillus luteolus]|uniref:glycosyltransferase family 8 protein n=1 Tax=Oceanobacillus luteolus TaxID=1274358 RepID=UPI002040CD66|nr:glycosyltransferase family 8 protein [Oceanobacillus luteolus]MCM3741695.1 glycosyltransferase family 8 protein [Oceanobacillus luteolus]
MKLNILVTLDSNYIRPLQVMLKSMFLNNPDVKFSIYLMHSSLKSEEVLLLQDGVRGEGHILHELKITDEYFREAPVVKHYTKEMYYRLLAFKFLPETLDRILYLDPDILIINEIKSLYDTDLTDYLYAAAYHDIAKIKELNKIRLKAYEMEAYYNSGVLLMNLEEQRKRISEQDIFDFVEENKKRLVLPDQDILNALYSQDIKEIEEVLYNYDARFYQYYKLASKGEFGMDYVINETSIIHFCGKKKPWLKSYTGKFHSLYKHYEKLTFGKAVTVNN